MTDQQYDNPAQFLEEHSEDYEQIKDRLELVKNRFMEEDRLTQRRMVLDSYIFAVISIQTPLDVHERSYARYTNGDEYEDAFREVNYKNNKISYIRETEVKFKAIDNVIDLLEANKIDEAHKLMCDEFKGVGMAKGAFTLAMLGFTSKMCVDTNVQQASGIEDVYSGVVVEKYENMCEKIRQQFSDLKDRLDPFMVQWVLFDYQRGEHRKHNVFFNQLLTA
jgi:thermostable 8-oxoguanine DNA glycosylase